MLTRGRKKLYNALTVCLVLAVLLIFVGPAAAAPTAGDTIVQSEKPVFTDLAADSPLYPYVRYLTDKGIVKGFPDGTFRPAEDVTRAQAARVMVLAKGLQPVKNGPPTFSDVPDNHWAYGEIEAATKAGLFRGYPDGTFSPDSTITRAEAITLLLNLSGGALSGKTMAIGDVGPDHWAYRQVVTAVEAGLVEFSAGKLFEPDLAFRRGDLARGLSVMFTLSPALRPADLTGKLIAKKGKVTVTSGNGLPQEVSGEIKVGAGDKIKIGDKSQAEIIFDDGSGIQLEANAEATITKAIGFNYMKKDGSPGVAVDKLVINLKNGRIFGALASRYGNETQPAGAKTSLLDSPTLLASTEMPPGVLLSAGEAGSDKSDETAWWNEPYAERERVVVDMPTGVAGIRGTIWTNNVTPNGESSTSLIIGHAVVTSGGITVSITAGQSTVTTTNGAPPTPPATLTPAEKQAWVAVANWVVERAQEIQKSLPPPPAPVIQSPEVPVDKPVVPVEQQKPEQQQQVIIDVVSIVTQSLSQATGVPVTTLTSIMTTTVTPTNTPAGGGGGGGSGGGLTLPNSLSIDTGSITGSIFSVPVNITNAEDIYAFDLKIAFDSRFLETVSVQPNSALFPLVVTASSDNATGTVRMVSSRQGAVAGINGSALLGTVTFKVIGNGSSNFSFTDASLSNSSAVLVTPFVQNTSITVSISQTGGSGANRVWLDTAGVSGSEFSVPIKVSSASDLYGADVTVSFDRSKLQALAVIGNSDQFPLVTVQTADNDNGLARLVLARQGNVPGLTGEVTLGTISFKVLSSGSSLLSFTDARLMDSNLNYAAVNAVNTSILF